MIPTNTSNERFFGSRVNTQQIGVHQHAKDSAFYNVPESRIRRQLTTLAEQKKSR